MYQLIRKTALFTILAAVPFIWGCSGNGGDTTTQENQAVSVRALVVEPVSKELNKVYTGTLEGEKQAVIRAKISEAVASIDYREGSQVKANAVIVTLDKTGASSTFFQTQSVFKNAEKNYNKMKYLYDQGAISEAEYDGAKTEYEVARANFEASRQTVELTTPISGTVTSVDVSVGDYVAAGQQVATVATIDRLRIKLGVNAEDIRYFNIGDQVEVYVENDARSKAVGKVITVAKSADPTTRAFQVQVELDNSEHSLKPGTFARAEIVIERFDNILTIPQKAIVQKNDKSYVYLVEGDRVKLEEIKKGVDFNGVAQVLDGLKPGDTVVTVGQDYLGDGFKIRLNALTTSGPEEKQL